MKKVLSVVLVLLMVLSFTACSENSEIKSTVNNALKAVKNYDLEGIDRYFVGEGLGEQTLQATGVEQAKAIFSTFSWKITECIEEEAQATVTVELTAVSFSDVMNKLAKEVTEKALSGELVGDLEAYTLERMSDIIKDKHTKTVTATFDFMLEKSGEEWKITNPDGILAVFTAGLDEIITDEK